MFSYLNIASEVGLLTGVSLTDVDRHKVGQAGEFGSHLAKLTKLGHEGRSGTGTEVDDERAARPALTEEADDLPGVEVVQIRAGGSTAFLGLLQRISYPSEICLL